VPSQTHTQSTSGLGGKKPTKPGEFNSDAINGKLPFPVGKESQVLSKQDKDKLGAAWLSHVINGLKHNEEMFQHTLKAILWPYYFTMAMYVALFVVGLILFVIAVEVGLRADDASSSAVAIVFGGLSVGSFIIFFIKQPLQALEENLEFISWLGIAYNTYWVRLLYMNNVDTIQKDLRAACDDYSATVERLIDKHAVLRGKRLSSEITDLAGKPVPSAGDGAAEAK
jgi:hypothetical protein